MNFPDFTISELYPPCGLVLRTPDLVLRVPESDEVARRLACAAASGVHDADFMPFAHAWTDAEPVVVAQRALANVWRTRVRSEPPRSWELAFAVRMNEDPDNPIGVMNLVAADYPESRTVATSSWLAKTHQGRGYGTQMRAAVLALAFGGMGARRATTSAFTHNAPSLGVTRKLGYVQTGTMLKDNRGEMLETRQFELTRAAWAAQTERVPVSWEGLDPVLEFFGMAGLNETGEPDFVETPAVL